MNSDQSFFKVVWDSEKLEIPLAFVSLMGGSLAKTCILRDVDENVWPVEVAAQGDEWSFRNGWTQFHREKSLRHGDILVFNYRGSDLFDVTVYAGDEKCELGVEESSASQLEECDDDDDEQENTSFGGEPKYKNHIDWYGADIFNSGVASRPNNPYFVSRSRAISRKNSLYIPKDVIKDYRLRIPKELFLADEQGRKWKAGIEQWKDGRLWCTGSWARLCSINHIKPDDTCICEFVQDEGCKNMCIRVVRVVSPDN